MVGAFTARGWLRFPHDPQIARWAGAAHQAGLKALRDEALSHWYQCENTWFVGVDAVPNDPSGALGDVPLAGAPLTFVTDFYGALPPLHRAQLSVVFPGYPRPRAGEGDAAFRYRLHRDAAHVDGLLPVGPDRRRMMKEPHAWILGLPVGHASADAAPMVVWDGSHKIMSQAFAEALADHPPGQWGDVDLTDVYHKARKTVFETCQRVKVYAAPGEAYLVHRFALHGVAPWGQGASADPAGRMVAYFRPQWPEAGADWLTAP